MGGGTLFQVQQAFVKDFQERIIVVLVHHVAVFVQQVNALDAPLLAEHIGDDVFPQGGVTARLVVIFKLGEEARRAGQNFNVPQLPGDIEGERFGDGAGRHQQVLLLLLHHHVRIGGVGVHHRKGQNPKHRRQHQPN